MHKTTFLSNLTMMEENKQKIIAMAMQMCAETSSDSDSDDFDEIYRIAKRPKMKSSSGDMDEIPLTDLELIKQFCVDLVADQRNFLRLDDLTFEKLLMMIEPQMQKKFINGNKALTSRERMILTLSYLATGRNYHELIFTSSKTNQTIENIVLETCDDLYRCLRNDYLRVPQTELEWKQIADNFELKWQFNKCLGIVGGKHVIVAKSLLNDTNDSPVSQNGHINQKYSNTILMAIVNDNFEFIYLNVCTRSRANDSGIWESSDFNSKIQSNALNIPNDYNVNGSKCKLPYVFIGDKSFPLRNNLLRPFALRVLPYDERVYNYRLARARRVFDNAFGVLTNRFQCFNRPIALDQNRIDSILLAACTLHNFLLRNVRDYVDLVILDYEDTDGGNIIRGNRVESAALLDLTLTTTSTTNNGKMVRNEFKKFFIGSGKVSFQDRMLERYNA